MDVPGWSARPTVIRCLRPHTPWTYRTVHPVPNGYYDRRGGRRRREGNQCVPEDPKRLVCSFQAELGEGDLFAEHWGVTDSMTMIQQLGAIRERAST